MKQEHATLLVGDVGGTNVRLALAHCDDGRVALGEVWKRPGRDFATFDDALAAFRREHGDTIAGAAFGMAGPVRDGQVELLHRGWTIDRAALGHRLGVDRITLVNDFMAMSRSAPDLGPDDSQTIASGAPDPAGSIAVGGPGTGFGIGVVRRLVGADGWVVVGGEGGHQCYRPQTDLEWRVQEILKPRVGYVSIEVIASGSGHDATWAALQEAMGLSPRELSAREVSELAETGDPAAVQLARLRAATVMTAMGDLALLSAATGGVCLAGGVTQNIAHWLREPAATDRFYRRGPREAMMRPIPIRIITSQTAPLIGAARLWLDERARGWL